MRTLLKFGVLGALIHLNTTMIMVVFGATIAQEYIISRELYNQMLITSRMYPAMESVMPWAYGIGVIVFIVFLWHLVAGALNSNFSRFPFNQHRKSIRAWLTWLIGGITFFLLVAMSLDTELDFGDPGYYQVVEWSVLCVAGAITWFVISNHGLGKLDSKLTVNLGWSKAVRVAGQGALFAGLLILANDVISHGFNALIIVLTESLYRSGELTTRAYLWSWSGLVIISGVGFALTFGLLPLFKPGAGRLMDRLKNSRPALVLLAIVAAGSLFAIPSLYNIHLVGDRSVAGVTGTDRIEPLSLGEIRLCTSTGCFCNKGDSSELLLRVTDYKKAISGLGFLMQGGDVPLHPDIVPVLNQFLQEHEHSVLRRSAMADVIELYRQLWQPRESYRAMKQFVQEKHFGSEPVIWTILRAAWLERSAPINDETRRLLSDLSDEKQYSISDRWAIRLASAWARFGNEQQMNRFLKQARQAYPDKYADLDLQSAKLTNGEISGRLVMPGNVTGIRLGLFREHDTPVQQAKARQSGETEQEKERSISFYWMNVVTSAVVSADGEFRFSDLGSGAYYLALLIPQDKLDGAGKVAGHNIPDGITLNEQNAQRDLGEIRLVPQ